MSDQHSKLLINEEPLQLLPSLAMAVGFNEAVVLQQLQYWMRNPKIGVVREDGRKWVFNTYEQWHDDNFPFWSLDTVKRAFLSLEKQGVILSDTPGGRDRKKWYTIDYAALNELTEPQPSLSPSLPSDAELPSAENATMHQGKMPLSDGAKSADASGQNPPMEEGSLPPPSGQNAPLLNKVSESTSENTQRTLSPSAPHAAPCPDGRGCECLTSHKSKFCLPVREAHAEERKLGEGWLNNSRDGRYDDLIERGLKRKSPEAIQESLKAEVRPRMGLREVLMHVKSVLDINAAADVEGLVSRLDCDAAVKAQALARAPELRQAARASP